MSKPNKVQKRMLKKLGIEQLNPMQEEAKLAIEACPEVVLLSPTGTGKTLAFLLPLVAGLNPDEKGVQALILTPSRELAIQIEQVARQMGTGYKINAVYGGRPVSKDKLELKHLPSILVGTPGRIEHHLRIETFNAESIQTLVLDEFDKSLEIGFEEQMMEIVDYLHPVGKKILTSATQGINIPAFVALTDPVYIDYSQEGVAQLTIKSFVSSDKDKLETLGKALCHLGNQAGIIFCNYKDSIQRISDYLTELNIPHGTFYGGLEQRDRERALIKFRNGTHQLLLATDLAARGIDIPEIQFIIHYHLPHHSEEFTHRNGRTARMHNEGTAYVLHWEEENLPEFIERLDLEAEPIQTAELPSPSLWSTIFVSGGRKDKISKGDIVGLFLKQGQLESDELGKIELKNDCAFVAVHTAKVTQLFQYADNTRLKKKKVRLKLV